MKKILFFLMAVILCSASAMAERKVSGTVVSELDHEPLIGATVLPLPLGSGNGTATDADGHFSLTVPATCHELQISFVGLQTRHVRITDGPMNIALSEKENRLDEVMVVAYGTAKRGEFTGSASVVKADEIADALVTSVTSVLQGKVSGVQTLSSDGRPGGEPKVRIRGVGSINASAAPLYVVDGVPYDGEIAALSNSEVESMTVLKDAASTALYGARGANGVILITTKKGAAGAAKVTLDARWGVNHRAVSNYNVIKSPDQYSELLYTGFYNQNITNGMTPTAAWQDASAKALGGIGVGTGYRVYSVPEGQSFIGINGKVNPNATLGWSDGTYFYTPDNWLDNTLQDGLRQEYSLSVAGGTDRFKYYVAANYLGDEGIIRESSYDRFSTRANVDYQAKTWLKIGTNLNYTYTRSDYPGDMDLSASTSSGNAFFVANQIAPIYPMFVRSANGDIIRTDANTYGIYPMYNNVYGHPIYDYGDGESTPYTRNWMSLANPVGNLCYNTSEYMSDIFDGKWYINLTPIEGLSLNANAGYWVSNDRAHIIDNPFYGQSAESKGFAEQYFNRTRSINLQFLGTYTKTFNLDHTIDLMVGYETYNLERENAAAYGYNIYNPNSWAADNTIDRKLGSGGRDIQYTTRGILARAKYNYQNKYFFHASYRRDSSSRFHPDKRWGNFFSVSAAWDLAKESFLQDVNWVDQLKFKASFGQNGNDNLGAQTYYYYAWTDQYKLTGANGVWSDATLWYKGNKDITWEKSNAFNIGFDFSFFNGKLDGTIEYYQRQVSDMLFFLPAAPSLGYDSYPANVGSMRNYGVEIELNYNVFNSKNFSWDINANLTTAGNKIVKLPSELVEDGSWINGSYIYKEGKSMYNMYLTSYAGVDEKTGQALYWAKTTDGQEVATPDYQVARYGDAKTGYVSNRKETGNLMPKVYGGFGTSLYLYGVDFSISFAYQAGGKIYDNTYAALMHTAESGNAGQNWHTDILNAWTPTNTKTDVPRINSADKYSAALSDRFLVSSNFLSLNNITLGYTLPKQWTNTLGIESIRVYGAAENVALWTKRHGLDPRQSYTTSSNSTYSPIRTISGGLRVIF